MSLELQLAVQGRLGEVLAEQRTALAKGLRMGVERTTDFTQARWRDQVTGAGLGPRLAKAVRKKVYPPAGKRSLGPAGFVYTKAPQIIRAFNEGGVLRSADGFYLAIPTPEAPRRGTDGKRISPSNFPEHRLGALRFVYRPPPRPSLLVADNVRLTRSGRVTANVTRRRRDGATYSRLKGRTAVVMFILKKQVRVPKRLNIASIESQAQARFPNDVLWGLNQVELD